MSKTIYFLIFAFSFSLAFTQEKPCCKNKKAKVACKLNQANSDADESANATSTISEDSNVSQVKCSNTSTKSACQKACNISGKKPWWKFWAKKKNCCSTKT